MTVVMVTHELDIARYTLRKVVMRDGAWSATSPCASGSIR